MKSAIWLFTILAIILIIYFPTFSKKQQLIEKNKEYEHQLLQLKQENKNLLVEKNRLENDPVYLEKVAREKMGLIKDGEVIYRITPVENKQE